MIRKYVSKQAELNKELEKMKVSLEATQKLTLVNTWTKS